MIFELPHEAHRFDLTADENWLPSPHSLFADDVEQALSPSPELIRRRCESIKADWDERERYLRRIRAQVACEFGVCRNF